MSGPDILAAAALGWTTERVALLRRHFAVGLTAAESGILLGVSKNAVISKRTRLGLVGFPRSAGTAVVDRPSGRSSTFRMPVEPGFRRLPLPSMDAPPPLDADPKPLARHRRGECVWPLGGAEQPGDWRTLFCCAPAAVGARYCDVHTARARR